MRTDLPAPTDPTLQSGGTVEVLLATSGTPYELATGAATTFDLNPYAANVRQGFADCTLDLVHDGELVGANRPRPGLPVQVRRDGGVLWSGIVESVSESVARGTTRRISVTARRRDGFPWWREVRRVTPLFSVGSDLGAIARYVAQALALEAAEYELPDLGVPLAHDSTQLADLNAWDMLEQLAQPAIAEPWVDARGVLKLISRDPRRPASLTLPWAHVVRLEGEKARPALTILKVKWLDPQLTKVSQQEQVLASETLMCGPFRWRSTREVHWSRDHSLRAENCRLEVKQSINDGGLIEVLPVGTESFKQTSPEGGEITVQYSAWNALIIPHELGALIAAHQLPEEVVSAGVGGSIGHTLPWPKALAVGAAELVLFSTLFRQGQGIYDVKGMPYDFVHTVNETDAYDQNAEEWDERLEVIENDLVPSQAASEGLAVAELFYRSRASSRATLVIADDPRIERGDILGLPDGRRFYVLEGSRNLTRGEARLLELEGFWS